jgi:hypothetical protein
MVPLAEVRVQDVGPEGLSQSFFASDFQGNCALLNLFRPNYG